MLARTMSEFHRPGELYPPIEQHDSGWLRVSDIHELYYEESGRKDGNPVVYLYVGKCHFCIVHLFFLDTVVLAVDAAIYTEGSSTQLLTVSFSLIREVLESHALQLS